MSADDVIERRADIVAQVGEERRLGAARCLGLELLLVIAPGEQPLLFAGRVEEHVGPLGLRDVGDQRHEPAAGQRPLVHHQAGFVFEMQFEHTPAGALRDQLRIAAPDQVLDHVVIGPPRLYCGAVAMQPRRVVGVAGDERAGLVPHRNAKRDRLDQILEIEVPQQVETAEARIPARHKSRRRERQGQDQGRALQHADPHPIAIFGPRQHG
jgi:hypothetical protein